jgi:peptidoglycan/xylan/chitin deacetylase (PgdA/CDA1 family)
LKKQVFNTLSPFSNCLTTSLYQKLSGKKLIFPFYHSIAFESLSHIDSLYTTRTPKEFKSDLNFLQKHYNTIEPQKAFQLFQEKKQPQKPSFSLSFDDGLSGFYYNEAPLLLEKGIPAVIFLNTAFIDNKDLFFRYKVSLLIHHLHNNPETIKLISVFFADNGLVKKDVFEALLSIQYKNRELLDKAAKICNFSFTDFLERNKPYLTSEQIKELSEKGFLFGAHSIDHPKYSEISFDEQIKQTQNSLETVKKQFNQSLSLFAFPFTDDGLTGKLFNQLFDKNNPVVDFSFGGAGLKNELLDRHIQRIPMEGIRTSGKKIIKTEYLYFLTKSLAGKNIIHR